MLMGPSGNRGDFQSAPPGTHKAVCYKVVDLGTQKSPFTNEGGSDKYQRKCIIGWELTETLMDDGRPFVTQNWYTMSAFSKATLRQHIESWMSAALTDDEAEAFNLKTLIGKTCLLNLVQRGDFVNVGAVMAAPGDKEYTPANPTQYLSLDPSEFDESVLQLQTPKLQEQIMSSPEYQALNQTQKPVQQQTTEYTSNPTDMGHAGLDVPTDAYEADSNLIDDEDPFA